MFYKFTNEVTKEVKYYMFEHQPTRYRLNTTVEYAEGKWEKLSYEPDSYEDCDSMIPFESEIVDRQIAYYHNEEMRRRKRLASMVLEKLSAAHQRAKMEWTLINAEDAIRFLFSNGREGYVIVKEVLG